MVSFKYVFELVRYLFTDNGFLFVCELQRPPPVGSSYLKTVDLAGYYKPEPMVNWGFPTEV